MKKLFYIIVIILLGIFSYIFYTYEELKYYEKILNDVDSKEFNITSYSIFGSSLNIEGCINKSLINPILVLKNTKDEIVLDSNFYSEETKNCFYINENNNKGINLDKLNQGDYLLLVKDDNIYYTLNNDTEYSDLEYYTITKNSKNNKINIDFNKYNGKNYLSFSIEESKLPENVYDISIDPGHGGKDPGAIGYLNGEEYYESHLTLKVSLKLKEYLEKRGYKVKITRDSDVYLDSYGDNGRAIIPNKYDTKYSFSIHFNSSYGTMNYGGVEVYTPNNIDYTFSKMLAHNLSNLVGYSKKNSFKMEDGVYYQYFTQTDIDDTTKYMEEEGLLPYDMELNSPYMYMIREVGGIHTSAYKDGRNKEDGFNKYYNSNKTAEPYLLELAYINCNSDLEKVVNNYDLFSKEISDAIVEYLNIS